jgi:hypothetical protein
MTANHPARCWQQAAASLALLILLAGCGDGDKTAMTAYGRADQVRAYRDRIDAVIADANAVQDGIEAAAVGTAGEATGENLSAALEQFRPQLVLALAELRGLDPPESLAGLHAEMERLLTLRLEALDQVAVGWSVEQAESYAAAQPLYEEAESKLNEARDLAANVNEDLAAVDVALAEAEGGQVVA